jgi:metal-responsive CopG/Arc/MetJ family transcriptional regulator
MNAKKLQRGAVKKHSSTFVGGWVPKDLVALLDQAVLANDTDRSKFIRSALKEKLNRELAEA